MDPVTICLLAGVGLVSSPLIMYGAVSAIGAIGKQAVKSVRKAKRYMGPSKEEARKRMIQRAQKYGKVRKTTVDFTNIQDPNMVAPVELTELSDFDRTKDAVFKTVVKIPNRPDEVIYVYQPRAKFINGVSAGPKYTQDGKLRNRNCYLLKDGRGIHEGYLPKREILSNVEFDYFNNSHNLDPNELGAFLKMEAKTDEYGNFEPVDLSDPQELAQLEAYIQKHTNNNINNVMYFENIKRQAQKIVELDKANDEKAAKDLDAKVAASRAADAKKEAEAKAAAKKPERSQHDIEAERLDREIGMKYRSRELGILERNDSYLHQAADLGMGGMNPEYTHYHGGGMAGRPQGGPGPGPHRVTGGRPHGHMGPHNGGPGRH